MQENLKVVVCSGPGQRKQKLFPLQVATSLATPLMTTQRPPHQRVVVVRSVPLNTPSDRKDYSDLFSILFYLLKWFSSMAADYFIGGM